MELIALALAFGKSLLLTLAGILPILSPPTTAPAFIGFTRDLDPHSRMQLADRIGRSVAMMLAVAMLFGTYVLNFFGVSIPIVRVAGGIIVALTAWNMLNAKEATNADHTRMARSLANKNELDVQAFYPLTFPVTCGPGSIAAAITVGAALHSHKWSATAANFLGGLAGMALIGAMVAVVFRYAARLLRPLGEIGMMIFLRMAAFILLCVGVQICWDGISELLRSLNA